ncbi:uncharacterized protein LOC132989400 [Labrus mixtus]|uniref:uncharacterized protein LOC132989400 n=1 Tax=Labrus mixtus TaxID=508554 RepID=UPI0029C041F3|nr:uncharacterized protein LOC132989400 [Labrus mixtus]
MVMFRFKRHFFTAVAFIVVSTLLLECTTTCQNWDQNDSGDEVCRHLKLTSALCQESGCVNVCVWRERSGSPKAQKIKIRPQRLNYSFHSIQSIQCEQIKRKNKKKCDNEKLGETGIRGDWEPVWFFQAVAGTSVTISYRTTSIICCVNYEVPDPKPDFDLSVNQSSKSVTVTVEPGRKVKTRWCYLKSKGVCIGGISAITIDPSKSRSALLNIPFLLPCVSVQAYYTHSDASRRQKGPFQGESLADVTDVWRSSKLTPFQSHLQWSSECPASDFQISASLCWQHEHLCTSVLDLTPQETRDGNLKYDTSAVDKHPNMCVKFSLQGSNKIDCPFQARESSWKVYIRPGRQSMFLYLTSSIPANFSAQVCALSEEGCAPMGQVHSTTIEGNSTETRMLVPLHLSAEKICVQVWQSDPVLFGRRILCMDGSHNRWGICAVAALVVVVVIALLGIFIHRLTKIRAAGWISIQTPVLLVCSSEHSAHVSAVCALASILQGDLSATVHMALWSQSSQTQAGARAGPGNGVADLGPLPWLYGQWETVLKAQGKVLIIWSPEAKKTYETRREERVKNKGKNEEQDGEKERDLEENLKLYGRKLGKSKNEKATGEKDCIQLPVCDYIDCYPHKEPSSVIAPVFTAALACLEGALQECKCQGVALVYFQGLCRSRDIPKAFRGIPRYCLPQDFRGIIQELGGIRRQTKTGTFRWHCWPRLLSKMLSIWLARRLARSLQALLPQTHGKKMQGSSVTSSLKMNSDKTQTGLKLPLASNKARPGTVQEHEPLHVSS